MKIVSASSQQRALQQFGNPETQIVVVGSRVFFRGSNAFHNIQQKTSWKIGSPLKSGNLSFYCLQASNNPLSSIKNALEKK